MELPSPENITLIVSGAAGAIYTVFRLKAILDGVKKVSSQVHPNGGNSLADKMDTVIADLIFTKTGIDTLKVEFKNLDKRLDRLSREFGESQSGQALLMAWNSMRRDDRTPDFCFTATGWAVCTSPRFQESLGALQPIDVSGKNWQSFIRSPELSEVMEHYRTCCEESIDFRAILRVAKPDGRKENVGILGNPVVLGPRCVGMVGWVEYTSGAAIQALKKDDGNRLS